MIYPADLGVEYCGYEGYCIDVFDGENAGLVMAEIELDSPDEPFEMPDWVLEEVSGDKRYRNACLVENPYSTWQ